jgi:hypothetical protein
MNLFVNLFMNRVLEYPRIHQALIIKFTAGSP